MNVYNECVLLTKEEDETSILRKYLLLIIGLTLLGAVIVSNTIQLNQRLKEEVETKDKEYKELQIELNEQVEKKNGYKEKAKKLEKDYKKLKESKAAEKKKVATITKLPEIKVGSGDCYNAMKKYFPESQWKNASLVIRKESGGRPNAVSPTNDHGCFQIHNGLAGYGNKIYNADFNARIAYQKYYKPRGWTPWYAVRGILW